MADTSSGSFGEPVIDLLAEKFDVFAVGRVIGHVIGLPHMAFLGGTGRIVAKGIVEALEIRQIGHVFHQGFDPGLENRPLRFSPLLQSLVYGPGYVGQGFDQVGQVAPGIVDVDLDQDTVA